jgi:glycosyltransferase involved in cell wall biosynthesis
MNQNWVGKIRITHVITGLGTGGAEMVLYRLLSGLDHEQFSCRVVVLGGEGPLGELIADLGFAVSYLGMKPGLPDLRAIFRLSSWLRQNRPHLVQTWMYHSDLIGGLAAWLTRIPVVWGIRNSDLSPGSTKKSTLWVVRICTLLSRFIPKKIVSCSQQSRNVHVERGYAEDKFIVIPNGFDLTRFHPDDGARQSLRSELGLDDPVLLVGMVARYDPQKDHHNLIEAARLLQPHQPLVRFVLCGDGISWDNEELSGWINQAGLAAVFSLLGPRQDIPRIMAGLDILVSSSFGEAFPNVLGEAMACGVPCVATDVGDSGLILGDTGRIVPPGNPNTLADALAGLLDLARSERTSLGQKARTRVQEQFSLQSMVQAYQDLYIQICSSLNWNGK